MNDVLMFWIKFEFVISGLHLSLNGVLLFEFIIHVIHIFLVLDMDANSNRPRKSKGLETCNWTTVMDEVLIDAYLHQLTLGNIIGNSMTKSAMDNILKELKSQFSNKPISKEKIKDHMKNIRAKWMPCYDIFQNALSGFRWDSVTHMWDAEDEVWDKLIETLFTSIG
jgi:hypothetical protein